MGELTLVLVDRDGREWGGRQVIEFKVSGSAPGEIRWSNISSLSWRVPHPRWRRWLRLRARQIEFTGWRLYGETMIGEFPLRWAPVKAIEGDLVEFRSGSIEITSDLSDSPVTMMITIPVATTSTGRR